MLVHLGVKPKVLLASLILFFFIRHGFVAHLSELARCRALGLDVTIDRVPLRVVE